MYVRWLRASVEGFRPEWACDYQDIDISKEEPKKIVQRKFENKDDSILLRPSWAKKRLLKKNDEQIT